MATRLFEPGAANVLYVVDLSGYVFRAYHAIAPLTSPSGEPTNAVFGTVNMLERLLRQCRPTRVAVAMDSRTRTFRKDLFPEYKANRPPPPEDLRIQMKRVGEVIDAFGIHVLQQDGVEADDLIASVVTEAKRQELRVVVVSADKDLMQLVSDDVILWDTMRDKVFGPPEVEERFGVSIPQLRDLLALTGDSSDNIPGVPSVGPKTAQMLLQEHGTLEGIYENLASIKRKKLKETLEENHAQALLSQKLVTLKDDCLRGQDLDRWQYTGRNKSALRPLYETLGFTRQLAALEAHSEAPSATETSGPAAPSPAASRATPSATTFATTVLSTEESLRAALRGTQTSGTLCLSLATVGADPMRTAVVGIAFCHSPGEAFYVPLAHRYVGAPAQLSAQTAWAELAPVLRDPKVALVGHDLKHLLLMAERAGVEVAALGFDALLASYLLDPTADHSMERLAKTHVGVSLTAEADLGKVGRRKIAIDEVEVGPAAECFCSRVHAALLLVPLLRHLLQEEQLAALHDDLELPLTRLLATMEAYGICLNVAHLAELGKQLDLQLSELEKRAHAAAGKEFNVNSPRQLESILFDELHLKPLKRTKTSRSTDAATLEALEEEHPLPGVILELRQLSKLKGTYIDALPLLVDPKSGRIHTRWGQAVAATGRLSSHDPNLQNIPIRSEVGRSIRDAFIAPEGFQLVSADYSQVELRVLAHLSQDAVLLDAFRTGQDIHLRTAMEIFNVAEADVDAEFRRRAKAVNFGVVYGQGDSGLAKSLGIPRAEAASFIAAYFRRYEGVRRFMDATLQSARAGGSVRTLLGRHRLVPDIRSANRAVRLAAERIAMNTPIQGTAADILKLAMLKLREPVAPGARMLLTVHDELVFEVPEEHVERASQRISDAMTNAYQLDVPLVVDVGHGKTWSKAH